MCTFDHCHYGLDCLCCNVQLHQPSPTRATICRVFCPTQFVLGFQVWENFFKDVEECAIFKVLHKNDKLIFKLVGVGVREWISQCNACVTWPTGTGVSYEPGCCSSQPSALRSPLPSPEAAPGKCSPPSLVQRTPTREMSEHSNPSVSSLIGPIATSSPVNSGMVVFVLV